MGDRVVLEINLDRRRTDPAAPTVPGPVENNTQRIYSADYVNAALQGAINPASLNDGNTIFANSTTGNNANAGTAAAPKLTIGGPGGAYATAIAGALANIALTGTFRERVDMTANINIVSASGTIATIEAPDNYDTGTAPAVGVAQLPGAGDYYVTVNEIGWRTGNRTVGAPGNVTLPWPSLVTGTAATLVGWTSSGLQAGGAGALAAAATYVTRCVYHAKLDTTVQLHVHNTSLTRQRGVLNPGSLAEAIPDSDLQNATSDRTGGAGTWETCTIDAVSLQGQWPIMAVQFLNRTAGGGGPAWFLDLYGYLGASSSASNRWVRLDAFQFASPTPGYYIKPALGNASVLSHPIQWHRLKHTNNRVYLLNPMDPTPAGSGVLIFYPYFAWDSDGVRLTFTPPVRLVETLSTTTQPTIQTLVVDAEYFDGWWYLSTSDGIYRSEDGLSDWVIVHTSNDWEPRFLHVCNGGLFASARRSANSALVAATTVILHTRDGVNWSFVSGVNSNYSGRVFSLAGGVVGIESEVSTLTPILYFQESVIMCRFAAVNTPHLDNIIVDAREKCGQGIAEMTQMDTW